MRIAMLAPIAWRTPPRHYGPWELVTSLLTEALVARGVDVTLFATLDSVTAGTLDGVVPAPYSEDPTIDAKVWEYRHLAHVFEQAGEFDLIHNQADFPAHAFSRLVDTPMVTTIHGFSSDRILPMYEPYRGPRALRRDQRRRPASRRCATPRRSTTASRSTTSRSTRTAATTCCSSAASTPTRAPPRRSPPRARAGARLDHVRASSRTQGYHEREVAPALDGDARPLSRRGRRRRARRGRSGRRARCST